ncbi:MAG: cysteine protease [Caeruleum heppii]|nr:MAG: cysteine protease [Caeruleum heppii]
MASAGAADGSSLRTLKEEAEAAEATIATASAKHEALQASIAAAELYMQALRLADRKDEKQQLQQKCQSLLEEAERLKQTNDWNTLSTAGLDHSLKPGLRRKHKEPPASTRQLTTKEKIILLENSKLCGFVFPPWTEAPAPEEFDNDLEQGLFLDTPELQLSKLQLEVFDGWKRAEQIFPLRLDGHSVAKDGSMRPSMTAHHRVDLVQDVTTDCSLVASLCAGTARAERGHPMMISSIFHPYDDEHDTPKTSPNGKYVFRLNFNGCFRRVVVDDRLPSSRNSRLLHVIDRNNPGLLWPALVEKAYLKVRGGYNFPGSNSGTDIWILTGWLPEQVFLRSEEVMPGQLWDRIYKPFTYGDVLVTVGTGAMTPGEESALGLAGQHDYAILDMREIGGRHHLLVKNPWSRGITWRIIPRLDSDDNHETRATRMELGSDGDLTPGTFWIDLNTLAQTFESVYLNWNPALFLHRQDIHFSWTVSENHRRSDALDSNPQYTVKSSAGGAVWLLLCRHFQTDKDRNSDGLPGFIGLYLFDRGGQRVLLSDKAVLLGPYVDSPQTLMRFDAKAGATYTVVVCEQALPSLQNSFTLSAFSRNTVELESAADQYPHKIDYHSAWTSLTAGGNAKCATYPLNPQFTLSLATTSDIALLLESHDGALPVHVTLVWANGTRVTRISTRDIVGQSPEYRRGCALCQLPSVEGGTYTIVCSTFDPSQRSAFSLRIYTTQPATSKPIPAEDAGKSRLRLPPACFMPGTDRLLAPVHLDRLTTLRLIARHQSRRRPRLPSPLRIRLELGQGPNKQILATSGADAPHNNHDGGDESVGAFSDAPMGVRTRDVDLRPDEMLRRGGVWVVLERFGGDTLGGFGLEATEEPEMVDVEVLSDVKVRIGEWGVGAG